MSVGRLPEWFKTAKPDAKAYKGMEKLIRNKSLHTVCHEANCPNKGKCFKDKSVTFMILGKNCTRNCSFCNVTYESPEMIDEKEPENIADAVLELGLKHIVITSVTRDDLEDGGASHFANVIRAIKNKDEKVNVEVLIPDLKADENSLNKVVDALPEVIGHNIETVPRLYSEVRPDADYQRSLKVLKLVKEMNQNIYTKSGLMVGLGETEEEVKAVMRDLRANNCDILTIGQYLRPSNSHIEIKEYIHPDLFKTYENYAKEIGFKAVAAGPFVRSSFNALETFNDANTI